jgi:PhnB protein
MRRTIGSWLEHSRAASVQARCRKQGAPFVVQRAPRQGRGAAIPSPRKELEMPKLNAYLSFDGNCADAMQFYARLFDAKLEALITYEQAQAQMPMPGADGQKIMHAYLVHPQFEVMAGDTPSGMRYEGVKGVMMTLTYPTAAEGRRVFEALADGGTVTMPPAETFWADVFGMVTDRFGVPWGVNGGSKPATKV